MIVRDGEGVSRFVTLRLSGARNPAEADAAARAVANSSLVKTSWNGGDPNWGRIIDALGYSPSKVVEEMVDIGYSAPGRRKILWSLKGGQPTKASFKELCAAVAPKEFDLHINLNLGNAGAIIYAADLTEKYVEFMRGGKVVAREVATVVSNADMGKIAKSPHPKGNGVRVDTLKGGDYVRVWIAKGGENYIINMPPAS